MCGIESKETTVCVFMAMVEHVTQSNSVAHGCVFGQEWSSMAQNTMKNISDFDTNTILISRKHSSLLLVFWSDLLSTRKI